MWMLSGQDASHPDIYYSIDGGVEWYNMSVPNNTWTRRDDAACVVDPISDTVILLGGLHYGGVYSLNEVWSSSDGGLSWTLSMASWAPRAGLSVASVYNSVLERTLIYVVAGIIGQSDYGVQGLGSNDVWVSSDLGATWTQLTNAAPWDIRSHARLTATSDGILILTEGAEDEALSDSYYPHDIWVSPAEAARHG
jgi:hypothetical protein